MIEELIFAGFGGQGILMGGGLIAQAAMEQGMCATWFPSYGPEMRGGTANCLVAYSDDEIGSPIFSAYDTALIMNQPSLEKFAPMVRPDGLLMVNSSLIKLGSPRDDVRFIEVPVSELATEAGSDRSANVVMVAAYTTIKKTLKAATLETVIREAFARKGDKVVNINLKALELGRQAAAAIAV
jgi:2-oxoglutarate ferredoxin oxidoreductase subunit gamma